MAPAGRPAGDVSVRGQLSSLRALLVLSMLMTEHGDENEILHLAKAAVPSLAPCRAEAIYLDGQWSETGSWARRAGARKGVEDQLTDLGPAGGPVEIPDRAWGWAYSLSRQGGPSGYLLVGAPDEPTEHEQFLLRVMAQQTSVALGNARLHARERDSAERLQSANLALEQSMAAVQRGMDIHTRLTAVAVAGDGQEGIAEAVHELTGYAVAIEDRWGNLRAWAGPDRPDPYPRYPDGRRQQLLDKLQEAGRPIRDRGRLVALARPRDDVVGVIALIDAKAKAGEAEQMALEHAATVLAMELARLRSVAETDLRMRRDLVEDLLAGVGEETASNRAQALGYDLGRTHRVVVAEGRGRDRGVPDETFLHAVRRAGRDLDVGSLMVGRAEACVLLAYAEVSWESFREAVAAQLGVDGHCRVGIGAECSRPGDFPRSYREAQLALRVQTAAGGKERATVFADLGIYQLLSQIPDPETVERFVRRWLGSLLDYDARRGSQLVHTLNGYLENGGNYDATARAISVHRSTLKYRLQRIREVSGYDLGEPDTHFNLQLATRAWRTLELMREPQPEIRPD